MFPHHCNRIEPLLQLYCTLQNDPLITGKTYCGPGCSLINCA